MEANACVYSWCCWWRVILGLWSSMRSMALTPTRWPTRTRKRTPPTPILKTPTWGSGLPGSTPSHRSGGRRVPLHEQRRRRRKRRPRQRTRRRGVVGRRAPLPEHRLPSTCARPNLLPRNPRRTAREMQSRLGSRRVHATSHRVAVELSPQERLHRLKKGVGVLSVQEVPSREHLHFTPTLLEPAW